MKPHTETSIDETEVAKFTHLAATWWDLNGPLKTLHDINTTRLAFIQKHVHLADHRILDVGCGGGILCEGMARFGGLVTGLDASHDAILAARSHAALSGLAIQYYAEPIEAFEAPLFPVITCLEMLEHVSDPTLVIHHAARLLLPGGLLFLSTINRTFRAYASVVLAGEYLLRLLPRQTHDFNKFIKPSELSKWIRAAGLETVEIVGMGYNPLTGEGSLHQSLDVNYLLVCRKSMNT